MSDEDESCPLSAFEVLMFLMDGDGPERRPGHKDDEDRADDPGPFED